MYIESATLVGFRKFRHVSISFRVPSASAAETAETAQRLETSATDLASVDGQRPEEHGVALSRHGNVTLLLGDNGSGKSSVLRGICTAILSKSLTLGGYRSLFNVRRGDDKRQRRAHLSAVIRLGATADELATAPQLTVRARISRYGGDVEEIELQDAKPSFAEWQVPRPEGTDVAETGGSHDGDGSDVAAMYASLLMDDEPGTLFIAAYGANRRIEPGARFDPARRSKETGLRYARVASMFRDDYALVPLDGWLLDVNLDRRNQVQAILNGLLAGRAQLVSDDEADTSDNRRTTGQTVQFDIDGTRLPMSTLADGFKALIGWISDLLYHLHRDAGPDRTLVEVCGVVLVDEIGLHLHPSWQQEVVQRLSTALPRLQFILSTHSPLVVGALRREAIRLLDREPTLDQGEHVFGPPQQETWGLSPDQLLLHDAFGLTQTRAPEFDLQLQHLERRVLAGDPRATLDLARAQAYGGAGLEMVDRVLPPP